LNESESSNLFKVDTEVTNNARQKTKSNNIEDEMIVFGNKSERDRKFDPINAIPIRAIPNLALSLITSRPQEDFDIKTKVVDNEQTIKLKLIGDTASQYGYTEGKKVWIISHGFKDKFGGDLQKIAEDIKKDHKDDIVLGLDWSNISDKDANSVKSLSADICRVPTWIKPASEVIYNKLQSWGLKKGNNLNLVGHSLGTLMSAEISSRFKENRQGSADKMILLDPPSEKRCAGDFNIYGGGYKVQKSPMVDRVDRFENRANYTYSIVGIRSLAGNHELAQTAHNSYWAEFSDSKPIPLTIPIINKDIPLLTFDLGNEHTAVVSLFDKLNRSDKLHDKDTKKEILSSNDYDEHKDFQNNFTGDPKSEGWGKVSWDGNKGLIEAGNDTTVNDDEVQWMWVMKKNQYGDNIAEKILK
jgi:hypothetical protein